MKNDKLEQLLIGHAEVTRSAVYAAFEEGVRVGMEEGVRVGIEQARKRMLSAISSEPGHRSANGADGPMQAGLPTYSELARQMFAQNPAAIYGAAEAAEYFKTHYRIEMDPSRMRSLLKALEVAEWAERLQPGRYRAGPRLKQEPHIAESAAH